MRTLTAEQQRLCKAAPESQRSLFLGVFSGERGRADAVRAKCLDCANFARFEVTHCRVTTCPLWLVRPYQTDETEASV
jgi:hypothetical protein